MYQYATKWTSLVIALAAWAGSTDFVLGQTGKTANGGRVGVTAGNGQAGAAATTGQNRNGNVPAQAGATVGNGQTGVQAGANVQPAQPGVSANVNQWNNAAVPGQRTWSNGAGQWGNWNQGYYQNGYYANGRFYPSGGYYSGYNRGFYPGYNYGYYQPNYGAWNQNQMGYLNQNPMPSNSGWNGQPGDIVILNPADNTNAMNYSLNGHNFTIQPGQSQRFANDRRWVIEFNRGGQDQAAGARYTLSPGQFKFKPMDSGWELVRAADQGAAQSIQTAKPPLPDDNAIRPRDRQDNLSPLKPKQDSNQQQKDNSDEKSN
jgi:hypothetical protein